jgi:hypothetical protein
MKPIELKLKENDIDGYAESIRAYRKYQNTDCVIAYRKSFLGTVLLIKGLRNMFGFVITEPIISRSRYRPELKRISLKQIQLLFNNQDENKLVVIDADQFKIFERMVLFDAIV